MANERPTTVIQTEKSSGAGWVVAIVLVVALVVGLVFFSRMSDSEAAKDNAVAGAANSVGNAAKDVGNAARDAADPGK